MYWILRRVLFLSTLSSSLSREPRIIMYNTYSIFIRLLDKTMLSHRSLVTLLAVSAVGSSSSERLLIGDVVKEPYVKDEVREIFMCWRFDVFSYM